MLLIWAKEMTTVDMKVQRSIAFQMAPAGPPLRR